LEAGEVMSIMMTNPPGGDVLIGTCGDTSALHAHLGDGINLVAIGGLRVIIKPDGDRFVAQGLEIDYAADGDSLADVQEAFANGLKLTLQENVRLNGSIAPMLRPAPVEIWAEFLACAAEQKYKHSQTSLGEIAGMKLNFYLQELAPAA
jgi:hypothetical protein